MKRFLKYSIQGFAFLLLLGGQALASYDKPYMGEVQQYKAKYEDTFVHLARDYNLGFVEIRSANPGVDPWIPGEGTELTLPLRHILPDAPHEGIVINLAEMRLFAFVNGDKEPTTYPLGIGREGLETPTGTTKIVRKVEGPIWTPTPRMRKEKPELPEFIGPGPDNPMGTHALYLGWNQYAIHGTDKPFGIGRRVSSGCIRLYPEAIKKLYEMIPVGTKVTVVNQPVKLAWIDDDLYLEAHTNMSQAIEMEETGQVSVQKMSDDDMKEILKVAGKDQDRINWATVRTAIKERKGYPVKIARRSLSSEDETAESEETKQEDLEQALIKIKEELSEDKQKTAASSYSDDEGKKITLNP